MPRNTSEYMPIGTIVEVTYERNHKYIGVLVGTENSIQDHPTNNNYYHILILNPDSLINGSLSDCRGRCPNRDGYMVTCHSPSIQPLPIESLNDKFNSPRQDVIFVGGQLFRLGTPIPDVSFNKYLATYDWKERQRITSLVSSFRASISAMDNVNPPTLIEVKQGNAYAGSNGIARTIYTDTRYGNVAYYIQMNFHPMFVVYGRNRRTIHPEHQKRIWHDDTFMLIQPCTYHDKPMVGLHYGKDITCLEPLNHWHGNGKPGDCPGSFQIAPPRNTRNLVDTASEYEHVLQTINGDSLGFGTPPIPFQTLWSEAKAETENTFQGGLFRRARPSQRPRFNTSDRVLILRHNNHFPSNSVGSVGTVQSVLPDGLIVNFLFNFTSDDGNGSTAETFFPTAYIDRCPEGRALTRSLGIWERLSVDERSQLLTTRRNRELELGVVTL